MWFKRKPKNRRLGRQYVLDVKLRSSQLRAARTRMAAMALGVVFATVFGAFLLWRSGTWALNRLIYENKSFAINEIKIETDGVIAADQLRRWAGIKYGDNLLALDLARVKRDLEFVPLVQSASVERILPRSIHIRVTEREPVSQVNIPRRGQDGRVEIGMVYLDVEGFVMLPPDPRQGATLPKGPADQLTVISGINSNELQPGSRIVSPQVQAALQLIVAFERSGMAGLVDLTRIDLSSPGVLVATIGQGGEITFGVGDLDQQLRRLRQIFDLGRKSDKAIASLDLAVTNNIPARWVEAAAAPAATTKLKPLRLKKKNV